MKRICRKLNKVANISKLYCYDVDDKQKRKLRLGKARNDQTVIDKVEISAHYEDSIRAFEYGVSFCAKCNGHTCDVNRAMCLIVLQTIGLVEAAHKHGIHLSMVDFFTKAELEHFLEFFTKEWYAYDWS